MVVALVLGPVMIVAADHDGVPHTAVAVRIRDPPDIPIPDGPKAVINIHSAWGDLEPGKPIVLQVVARYVGGNLVPAVTYDVLGSLHVNNVSALDYIGSIGNVTEYRLFANVTPQSFGRMNITFSALNGTAVLKERILGVTLTPDGGMVQESDSPAFAVNSLSAWKSSPIIFVHGIDPDPRHDPRAEPRADTAAMQRALSNAGWSDFKTVRYYGCDGPADITIGQYGSHSDVVPFGAEEHTPINCEDEFWTGMANWFTSTDSSFHSRDTSIEHLAYHLAWALEPIATETCISIVGYSMGGLITRYALDQVGQGNPDFPPYLCVNTVITLGTPFGGNQNFLSLCGVSNQCDEMEPGSAFLTNLGTASDAAGRWVSLGSENDDFTGAEAATASQSRLQATYQDTIGHSPYDCDGEFDCIPWLMATEWEMNASATTQIDAASFVGLAPWPVHYADLTMAYYNWACGPYESWLQPSAGSVYHLWPLPTNGGLRMELDGTAELRKCGYYVEVPAGSTRFYFAVDASSPGRAWVYDPTGYSHTIGCSYVKTCLVKSTVGQALMTGTYRIVVEAPMGSGPSVYYASWNSLIENDCNSNLDAPDSYSQAMPYPAVTSCRGDLVENGLDFEDWYSFTMDAGQEAFVRTYETSLDDYCLTVLGPTGAMVFNQCGRYYHGDYFTAPLGGTYRVGIGAANRPGWYDLEITKGDAPTVQQHDCGYNVDAGASSAGALWITIPTSCVGEFPLGSSIDSEDWIAFQADYGQTVTSRLIPPAGANFEICVLRPDATVAICSPSGAQTQELASTTADRSGTWFVKIVRQSGSGQYQLTQDVTGVGVRIIKDWDGPVDQRMPLDHYDDSASRWFYLSADTLEGVTSARLWVVGKSYACDGVPSETMTLVFAAAGNLEKTESVFDPCQKFLQTVDDQEPFDIPVDDLQPDVFNRFTLRKLTGSWQANNLYLGIDASDPDYNSVWKVNDVESNAGDLMWQLDLYYDSGR